LTGMGLPLRLSASLIRAKRSAVSILNLATTVFELPPGFSPPDHGVLMYAGCDDVG
jgi:hypothetical protein